MTKDKEVCIALGIPQYVLDEMELRAIRRSIAEEVFAKLFMVRRHRTKADRVMSLLRREALSFIRLLKEIKDVG